MPKLTRWFLKTAMAYLVASLALGVAMAAGAGNATFAKWAALTPVYYHLLMVGWIAQLIFGVAYWMFPKASKERPQGNERLGWATYALLNTGLVLRAVAEPGVALNGGDYQATWRALLATAALLMWLAGLAFVANTWGRVKGR